ncbi:MULTISPECIES: Asp-tRNA(Asn)/Glu-tRNA(Gln) amidotransferase subunit GatB [Rossellomorea]|jgi:aspartyl-tRNA(Asn)/glutamyl-tRNA(Gln) amidotransferase subunit B|uniref:Aspartyl/glutamyl-tRNA(Asn/Gln) amidotransferase subunit B n=1 Tax=Rossellomorea aquimaris TaxID=189382 RepID=A0A5D4ULC7_9BACI|nr:MULTISPECIES: Asp-tRNA(Asn)/Glu-tRNA(Gln) amidotransferase subunit GatB [Rossellomorea]MDT9027628.1 Asp-tRNA(Asn)/Glu-tRNA(Gln) amidotransferase subunit GatB [Rossellomorea sp. YC4-1]TYS81286.1 Asp-tRNA(Asn)/Glu-tRNA(Gln) amidotransferase subunit GatB [Rossellomorea aquimaris]TYS87908.1 Asp-tRNA(Asn)/Glu-tRNA(Gln) amidotransferase subunit GatB [Rossellomorea aquimaris]TYS90379.1 Asp-tRNA(Asn)/Glu-tRNA(Gln) amidotransferase subunit GatB [Rossellomorea aquimaris]
MNFEPVIGLEVHVELKTDSKMFSPAPNHFGAEPNTNTNVIDLGYPGVLPVVNKRAIEFGMKAAIALNCEIATDTKFDRKNYFYPDNPKAYQISQFDKPIGENGWIEIEVNGEKKRIGITRLHLEEDAGKLTHSGDGYSLVDYNRQGTPLIEIVSEPDIRTPEEAYAYLEKLKSIIQYTGVSDCKMEEGSLRCDANISLRPIGQEKFGTKAELKNLNSFNFVKKGLEYEIVRQEKVLLSGGMIQQETLRFDESTGKTILMRVKEGSDDYRYFPEPDLLNLHIDQEWMDRIRAEIPELPDERKKRYVEDLGLPAYDAMVLTLTKEMSDFFQETVEAGADAKLASNWLMGEVSAYLNAGQKELEDVKLTPQGLAGMIELIEKGTISSKIAKKVFKELVENGGDPEQIVKDKGLVQISDEGALLKIVTETLDANPQSIEDYKNGKDRAIGFLVGQIMKATKGQANPPLVNKLLLQEIQKR